MFTDIMHRRNVVNGDVEMDGWRKEKNGNVVDESKELQKPVGDGSHVRRFFLRTFVPLFLMSFTPNLVIVMWYTAVRCDGSFARLFQILSDDGFLAGIGRIWTDIHIASPIAVMVLVGYLVWALVLMVTLPGPMVEGPVTPNGNIPRYRDNGFACYVTTMISFTILAALLPRFTGYSVTIVYDHFDEFLGTLTVFSHILCIFLHVKGLLSPSTSDYGTSGNLVFDYYWGTELYPVSYTHLTLPTNREV